MGIPTSIILVLLLALSISSLDAGETEISLPFPSSLMEIKPTLSIYSSSGDPKCFFLEGGASALAKDLVRIAGGHGAWHTPRVIFITHGYRDSVDDQWLHVMKNALTHQRAQTVVLVGWGGGSNLPDIKFKKAAGNIKSVGMWLGEIVGELRKMKPDLYIWGIGHSLGAHLMGLAGRTSPGAFDRITGLDPSGPFFEFKNLDMRLERTDAQVVDVIHSDGCNVQVVPKCWVSPSNHYATLQPLGTIDFYPNFGVVNPTTNLLEIDESHKRAVNLFLISIMHKGLFLTNETLDGTPGYGSDVQSIRQVGVTAEMGYWLENGFIPSPQDTKVNFYINKETMKVVDRMVDVVNQQSVNHHQGMRHRRGLVKSVDCSVIPGSSHVMTPFISVIVFGLALIRLEQF